MNKKILLGFVAVFIVMQILDFFIKNVILGSLLQSLSHLWRPDMKMGIFPVIGLIVSFFFTVIYSRWCKGTGIIEGIQYGFYVGMMIGVSFAYGSYAMLPIPYALALQWFLYTLIEFVIFGIILSLLFRKSQAQATA